MKYIKYLSLLLLAFVHASCDSHIDVPDTSRKIGHILCADGSTISPDKYDSKKQTAIGVVFYLNHDDNVEGEGYAVYLHDLHPYAFADSLGVKQGTSANLYAFDGNENTYALLNARETKSPMAEAVFDIWHGGRSAYIPSVGQMRLMLSAKEMVNPVLLSLGCEPLAESEDDCWYWTSTEVKGQEYLKAWLYSTNSGSIQETPKWQSHKARPIITLNK